MQPFCISEFFKQKLLIDSEHAPEQTAPQTVRFHYHNFHRFLILSINSDIIWGFIITNKLTFLRDFVYITREGEIP